MTESRNEQCTRCGCIVIERDVEDGWHVYTCPMCGNGWSWRES